MHISFASPFLLLASLARGENSAGVQSANLLIYKAFVDGKKTIMPKEMCEIIKEKIPDAPIEEEEVAELMIIAHMRAMVPLGFHITMLRHKEVWSTHSSTNTLIEQLRASSPTYWEYLYSDDELMDIARTWYNLCIAEESFRLYADKCAPPPGLRHMVMVGESQFRALYEQLYREEQESLSQTRH